MATTDEARIAELEELAAAAQRLSVVLGDYSHHNRYVGMALDQMRVSLEKLGLPSIGVNRLAEPQPDRIRGYHALEDQRPENGGG